MNDTPVPLLGVVLIGGQSLRMGTDKAELPHERGGTYAQHAIARLADVCDEVAVSTAPGHVVDLPDQVTLIEDPVAHRGPIIGVAESLSVAEQRGLKGILVTPVDVPDLTLIDLRRLVDGWNSGHSIVCASDESTHRIQPLLAVYSTKWLATLRSAGDSADRSMRGWLQTHPPHLIPLPHQSCRNVNSPDDL